MAGFNPCFASGTAVSCFSVARHTETKYGNAVYKVEANLDGFDADGGFRLSYRTLVKLLGSEAAADQAALRNAADDDAGLGLVAGEDLYLHLGVGVHADVEDAAVLGLIRSEALPDVKADKARDTQAG